MYKWYDTLKEPLRFYVFFIPAALLIAGINIHHYGIDIVSWGLLSLALITRAFYIHWPRKANAS